MKQQYDSELAVIDELEMLLNPDYSISKSGYMIVNVPLQEGGITTHVTFKLAYTYRQNKLGHIDFKTFPLDARADEDMSDIASVFYKELSERAHKKARDKFSDSYPIWYMSGLR